MPTGHERDNEITLVLTALVVGAAAIIGAMMLLDVENWKHFAAYFVLIPVANICFAIALWLGIHELTKGR